MSSKNPAQGMSSGRMKASADPDVTPSILPRSRWGLGTSILVLVLAAVLGFGAGGAYAVVVDAAPGPVSSDAPGGPPPIPALPAATGEPPPADAIADPVTSNAVCGGWHQQSNYGERWPAGSTWWEYSCSYENSQYYDPCAGGSAGGSGGYACTAVCYGYPWDCYGTTEGWADYFYWDGSDAVFYGQNHSYSIDDANGNSSSSAYWWDGPTRQWYNLGPYSLNVSKYGPGSGEVSSTPAGISCGYNCRASFDGGTQVTLTANPNASSIFTGWSGDCSGTGECQITMDQARSVTATFAAKRPPPPTFMDTDPASPANGNSPRIRGSADPGSTVRLYTTADCSGSPAATGTAAEFASPGIAVSVADDSSTTFHATATDTAGNASVCSSDSRTYVEDSTPPSGAQITTALANVSLTTPFTVAWDGATDSGSGVKSYDAFTRSAPYNGSYGSWSVFKTTSGPGSESNSGQPGNSYCFRVTATDNAANTSGPSADECTTLPVDDPSLAGSGWTRATGQSGYYRGTYSRSSTKGATLTLAGVQAERISLVATTCPSCGKVKVLQGGALLNTLNLYSASLQTERILSVASFSMIHTGTVTLKVATSGKPVTIDGLAVEPGSTLAGAVGAVGTSRRFRLKL